EAPFLFHHDNYWYLFVSFDFCCRGAKSDYKVVVGRAPAITGPFVDKGGTPMSDGGGSLVLDAATEIWHDAGHEALFSEDGSRYFMLHAYAGARGLPRLHISTIEWRDGWPMVAELP